MNQISATINTITEIQGELSVPQLSGQIAAIPEIEGVLDIGTFTPGAIYHGSYVATPTIVSQSLPTQGYYMEYNVTINAIPFSETLNPSGGNTINIAGTT